MNGAAARVLRSTWGALLILFAVFSAGAASMAFFSGLTSLPERTSRMEERLLVLEAQVASDSERDALATSGARKLAEWTVCAMIPPHRRDVLAALEIPCTYRADDGMPVLPDLR